MSTQTTALAPVAGVDISRQEAARQACEAAGIVWPGTILPPGTALYSSGVESLKSYRQAWRQLPVAGEVVGLVADALQAEDRKDVAENVGHLRFRKMDGRLVRAENIDNTVPEFGLGYGPHTLRQLVQQIDPLDNAPRGFSAALLYLSDQERAEILNKRLAVTDPETAIVLRTKKAHEGDRICRAALSKVYGSVTDHDIAGALGETLKGDSSGRLDYKPGDSRSRFEVIWPSEIPVETFVVGDVHYACLSIGNSETGEGGLRIAPAVIRARCANLTLSTGHGTEVVIRHVGDPGMLLHRLKKAIRAAVDDLEPLLAVITASARIPLNDVWTPEKAFQAIAKRYEQPKETAGLWLKQLQASNYPASIWGIGAAISEAAHAKQTWGDEADWERLGSEVQRRAVEVVRAGSPASVALEKALSVN